MNKDQFDDLKQFIVATVSQSEARLDQKIESLRSEMRDGFTGVAEAIDEIHTQLETQDKADRELSQRLTKLEQRAA